MKFISIRLKNYLENISLFAVLHYAAFRFLQSTTFPFIYSDSYKMATILSLLFFGGLLFLYKAFLKWKTMEKPAEKIKWILSVILACSLSLPFVYIGLKHDLKILVFMPLTALCLYDVRPEKVLKSFVILTAILLAATIVCCLSGCIRNITSVSRGYFAGSYGICNTTDFAAYFLFLMIFIWCFCHTARWYHTLLFIAFISFIIGGVYLLSRSRTTLICGGLLSVFVLWEWIDRQLSGSKNIKAKKLTRVSDIVIISLFPVIIILLSAVVYLYDSGKATEINNLISERIHYIWLPISTYGITLLGTVFKLHGNGGSIIHSLREYDFLESSYSFLLVRYGLIISIIFFSLWVWMIYKAVKSGRKRIALAMIIMSVYAISESHIQEINYNILTAMPFCAFTPLLGEEKQPSKTTRSKLIPFASAAIIALVFFLILPTFLSWSKTIVYLQKWNSGMKTLWPFIICFVLFFSIFLIWKTICKAILEKKYKYLLFSGFFVILLCVGGVLGNGFIQQGLITYADDLSTEKSVLQTVCQNAKQPVYSVEKSELYQRTVGSITNTVMAPEDLCRKKEGTIITSKDRDIQPITEMGGYYLQFSETSGIYSFDAAVIDSLTAQGYTWEKFYNSERYADLEDLAQLNNLILTADGSLILNGQAHSILSNRQLDQFKGSYEVRFDLAIDMNKTSGANQICILYIKTYDGERQITKRRVFLSDFDSDGKCSITIPYALFDTPRLEYWVEGEEGVECIVDAIAWKRVSLEIT